MSLRDSPSSIWSATALLSQPRAILDHCSIRNDRTLRHDDDAVANEICAAWAIGLGRPRFIQQSRVAADARVLVDDRALDGSSRTDAHPWQTLAEVAAHLFERLINIGAHHERRVDLHPLRNAA